MKVRGMRDVPGPQSVVNRKQANSREQAVTDLTRLEHEKARLERELSVWTSKQETTSRRLDQIRGQLELLQNSLYGSAAPEQPGVHKSADEADAPKKDKAWREIALEY
jgi:hypothetical protein